MVQAAANMALLRELVRRRHVHFEVRPETVLHGDSQVTVGFELRLWTVHDKGAHALPGCPKCQVLASELGGILQAILPEGGRPTVIQVEPLERALYDSQAVAGADEVEILVRLFHRDGYDRPVDACEERCMKEIRSKLRQLGVPER